MITTILAQIGLPLLLKTLGASLADNQNPALKAAGKTIQGLSQNLPAKSGAAGGQDLQMAQIAFEKRLTAELNAEKEISKQINQTIRAETASGDRFVRSMRPTFGYIMALSWGAQMGAVSYVMIASPEKAPALIEALASLGVIWTIGLSVLGVYVYKRSGEKRPPADTLLTPTQPTIKE